jgi:hypothetical protein
MSEQKQPSHRPNITVAERARRAAGNVDRIADAATGAQSAAKQLESLVRSGERSPQHGPLQLEAAIGSDLIFVRDWLKWRRDAGTADSLWNDWEDIARLIHKRPSKAKVGALILDLFRKARLFAWSLRRLAAVIEVEEGPAVPPPGPQTSRASKADSAHRLNSTQQAIIKHCRKKAHKGERIANHLGLSYDHTRRVLALLVKEGHLRTTENGYRTVKRAT